MYSINATFVTSCNTSRNDRLNEFVMLIYIYNNAMPSCNERTTLHCVESYLYYVILVNKKIFSEEWNEGDKIYIYEFWRVFSYLFNSDWKWIIYFPTKKLSNCLKRAETSVVLIVFDCLLCEVRAYKLLGIMDHCHV